MQADGFGRALSPARGRRPPVGVGVCNRPFRICTKRNWCATDAPIEALPWLISLPITVLRPTARGREWYASSVRDQLVAVDSKCPALRRG